MKSHDFLKEQNSILLKEVEQLKAKITLLEKPSNKTIDDLLLPDDKLFDQIFETNQAVKLIIDPEDGRILKANGSAVRFYAYDMPTLISMRITDINCSTEIEVQQEMDRARNENRLYFNFRHKLASGEIRNVEVFSGPIQVGERTLLYSIIHDTSDRVQALRVLQENEKLLLAIADNFPNSFVSIIENDYTVGFTSGQEYKNQGLDPTSYIGLSLDQVFGDRAPWVRDFYRKTFLGEEQSFELFISDQHQFYRTVPLTANDGSIPRILVVTENITQRKRVEAELKSVFESKLIGILFWNAEGDITDANEAFLDMMGYTEEELLNRDVRWRDMTPVEYLERDEQLLQQLAQVGYIAPVEKEYYHKDGHRIPIMLGAATLSKSTNKGVAFVLDITQIKQAEKELRTYKDHLEELVKERTKELEIKNKELDNTLKVFVGRELTIRNLQKRIRELGGK